MIVTCAWNANERRQEKKVAGWLRPAIEGLPLKFARVLVYR